MGHLWGITLELLLMLLPWNLWCLESCLSRWGNGHPIRKTVREVCREGEASLGIEATILILLRGGPTV